MTAYELLNKYHAWLFAVLVFDNVLFACASQYCRDMVEPCRILHLNIHLLFHQVPTIKCTISSRPDLLNTGID